MRNVYSVKQVNAYIGNMFAQDFMLNRIYVKGEVSNCKYHTSGHIYFSLKDESGTIACVMFAGHRNGLSFRMQEGQQVVVSGSISVYERDGKYQLYAKEITKDGEGLLYERFQKLKRELEEMGMFAPEYKMEIPKFARKIGVVTAPTGAAVRDIIHVSKRRNPYVQIILCPAIVQGEEAAESIVRAIRNLQQTDVDVIIVGRGGGSIEDLWAFNEEAVARAVFDCDKPVISAVGHETDTTIIDYVADLRAATPSAAAELATFDYFALQQQMNHYRDAMTGQMQRILHLKRMFLEGYAKNLMLLSPDRKIKDGRQRTASYEDRIRALMTDRIEREKSRLDVSGKDMKDLMKQKILEERHKLAVKIERLKGLSPLDKLNQGFSYVQNSNQCTVRKISDVQPDEELSIYVTDGRIRAKVMNTGEVT